MATDANFVGALATSDEAPVRQLRSSARISRVDYSGLDPESVNLEDADTEGQADVPAATSLARKRKVSLGSKKPAPKRNRATNSLPATLSVAAQADATTAPSAPANPAPADLSPPANPSPPAKLPATKRSRKPSARPRSAMAEQPAALEDELAAVDQSQRPRARAEPPAHATSRAALAETLVWFRCYFGGTYQGHGLITGFYLAACNLSRPHFDADVVITRCAGHQAKVDGALVQCSDASADDAQVAKMRINLEEQRPFPVIVSNAYQHCPSQLKYNFNVMGWFQVTDIWAEVNGGFKTYLYRLERVRRAGNEAWWMPEGESGDGVDTGAVCKRQTCSECGEQHKQVYAQGWTCLNADCAAFWTIEGRPAAEMDQLRYDDAFLAERHSFPEGIAFPYDMVPPEPTLSANEARAGGGTDRRMWKGFVCAKCKLINARRHWLEYRCDDCGRVVPVQQLPMTMAMIRDAHSLVFTGHALHQNPFNRKLVHHSATAVGWYVFNRYDFGDGNTVFHVQSCEPINRAVGGPDEMLQELQTDRSLDLQRRSLGNKSGKAEGLVNHFSENFGLPYKYIVAQDSKPFSKAPKVILRSLERCQWVAEQAVGAENFDSFNEVLAVAYMEEGKMGYHDDGEKELGDTVVAMCVGGDATMKVRMKDQYYRGFTAKDARTFKSTDPSLKVPRGALMEEERRQLNASFQGRAWDDEAKAEHGGRMRGLVEKFKKDKKQQMTKEAPDLLEMKFRHGDFMVMHGRSIQQYYEHGVTVDGRLRFALTARHVKLTEVDAKFHHLGDREERRGAYDGARDGNPLRSEPFDLRVR